MIASKGFILYMHSDKKKKTFVNEVLTDYKFFCFEGIPKFMYISRDKADEPSTDLYDMDGKKLEMRMRDPNSKESYPLPHNFDLMKKLSTELSRGFHHLRVDFYECSGRLYVGELTFYHCSGFARIYPTQWEQTLGDWIDLSRSFIENESRKY